MKNTAKSLATLSLAFLTLSLVIPTLVLNNAKATNIEDATNANYSLYEHKWWKIQTDLITILFPAGGKKPMFLWWYSNDTNNIYVVKYKGLVEYMTLDQTYYTHKNQADNVTLKQQLEEKYAGSGPHRTQMQEDIRKRMYMFDVTKEFLDFHPAYLPFSACRWTLEGPTNVTRNDGVSYISFNFTLVQAPPKFDFAENNVIIRCRFYRTDATENSHGQYNYTVHAGELKMDLIVKNWDWNVDKLTWFFTELSKDFNITIPQKRAGLALWTDLASIEITDIPLAEQDANGTPDIIEGRSKTSDIVVGGQRVQVQENKAAMGDEETPIRERVQERYKLRFAKGSQTLAGFFDFIDKANIINATTGDVSVVNVTAAYISAGAHMRVFISYPYFGANILEHDPSIGVESVVPWISTNVLLILVGATIIIAVAVVAVKVRYKTVNVLNVK